MAANLFRPFFRDPWNWFDTVRLRARERAGPPSHGGGCEAGKEGRREGGRRLVRCARPLPRAARRGGVGWGGCEGLVRHAVRHGWLGERAWRWDATPPSADHSRRHAPLCTLSRDGAAWDAQAVIAVSLWGLAGGGSIIFLRVFRAFRVMRLFKKLQPMRKILISLGACVKPVLSAFVILFILASIYAQVLSHGLAKKAPLLHKPACSYIFQSQTICNIPFHFAYIFVTGIPNRYPSSLP
jgi:hypothetical protein